MDNKTTINKAVVGYVLAALVSTTVSCCVRHTIEIPLARHTTKNFDMDKKAIVMMDEITALFITDNNIPAILEECANPLCDCVKCPCNDCQCGIKIPLKKRLSWYMHRIANACQYGGHIAQMHLLLGYCWLHKKLGL